MPPDRNAECCRCGLITWAIMKTLVGLVSFGYLFIWIDILFIEYGMPVEYNVWMLVILLVLQMALLVDIGMNIMLIVGESKENYNIIIVYFHYAVYAVIAAIIIITVYTAYELAVLWGVTDSAPWRELRNFKLSDVVKLATIGTIYVLFEVFIVYLLRAEVVLLKKQQKLNCQADVSSDTESFTEA